jgi:hypothetical protein
MVKMKGAGGWAFWVKGLHDITLHTNCRIFAGRFNENKPIILANSTHFNPVDLVLRYLKYKQQRFDLTQFVDADWLYCT